jgi:membrane protein DedA with SNARE-associated domain
MKLRTFAAMTLIGSFGWSVLLIYLGYAAGNLWQTLLVQISPLLLQVGLYTVALASISYAVYYLSQASQK